MFFGPRVAEGDNDQSYDADGTTVNLYAWGLDLKTQNYLSSYIPTSGAPVVRLTEASNDSDLNGYTWTTGSGVSSSLAAAGTYIITWKALQDHDAEDTSFRGMLKFDDDSVATRFIYFDSSEGDIKGYDGTNIPRHSNINWSKDDELISVIRFDETLDGGSGLLNVFGKKNDTWDLNATEETAFDGAFVDDGVARIAFLNEIPWSISSIAAYNTYLTDEEIQREIWLISGGEGWNKLRFRNRRWSRGTGPWQY
jgi:hypothetical protein